MTVITPPLFLNIDETYGAAALGLPYRDLVGEGVVGAGALAVTERGAGPNMSVDVAAGVAWVRGDDADLQPVYRCVNDGTVNLAIAAADNTNERIDLVVAEVRDATFSGVSNDWRLRVITGTPAGSPTPPALPSNAIALAEISVPASDTTIANGQITDLRGQATAGLVVPTTYAEDADDGTRGNGSYGNLTGSSVGPAIEIPADGLYLVHIEAQIALAAAGFGVVSYSINGSGASDDNGFVLSLPGAGGVNVARERVMALEAGDDLVMVYRDSGTTGTFSDRLIWARRVG